MTIVQSPVRNPFGIDVRDQLRTDRFAMVRADAFSLDAEQAGHLASLKESWDRLGTDPFFGGQDVARRTRRYSDFGYTPSTNALERLEHVPYYQSPEMNSFVGGKERHFEDVEDSTVHNPLFRDLVALDFESLPIEAELLDRPWICQVHQIRIEVHPGATYVVVPEGIHSDGYPFAGLHLMHKEGVTGAENQLFTWDEETELLRGTMEQPLDSIIFEDKKMKHYASPLTGGPHGGRREILAISFSLPSSDYETRR